MDERAYELPADGDDPLSRLADAAAEDQIAYLTRDGVRVAAVVPVDVAVAGSDAVRSLEDAADAEALRASAASTEPRVRHDRLMAELGLLDRRPDRA